MCYAATQQHHYSVSLVKSSIRRIAYYPTSLPSEEVYILDKSSGHEKNQQEVLLSHWDARFL
jgi:hypothetical protein